MPLDPAGRSTPDKLALHDRHGPRRNFVRLTPIGVAFVILSLAVLEPETVLPPGCLRYEQEPS